MFALGTPENEQQFSIARSQRCGVSIIHDHSKAVVLTKIPENRDSLTQRHHNMDEDVTVNQIEMTDRVKDRKPSKGTSSPEMPDGESLRSLHDSTAQPRPIDLKLAMTT